MKTFLLPVATIFVASQFSFGAPVTGTLDFAGTAIVSLHALDFAPPADAGYGTILTLAGGTGTFASLPFGSTGQIKDRNDADQPAGQPLNVQNYLTLSALPDVRFTLDFIAPGSFPSADCTAAPANGQTCTLPPLNGEQSPYNFTNYLDATRGISSAASFSVRGRVWDVTTPDIVSNYNGVFTATFLGRAFQTNLQRVLNGGTATAPFSAAFTTTSVVPEPSTALLILAGVALMGIGRLGKRRSA